MENAFPPTEAAEALTLIDDPLNLPFESARQVVKNFLESAGDNLTIELINPGMGGWSLAFGDSPKVSRVINLSQHPDILTNNLALFDDPKQQVKPIQQLNRENAQVIFAVGNLPENLKPKNVALIGMINFPNDLVIPNVTGFIFRSQLVTLSGLTLLIGVPGTTAAPNTIENIWFRGIQAYLARLLAPTVSDVTPLVDQTAMNQWMVVFTGASYSKNNNEMFQWLGETSWPLILSESIRANESLTLPEAKQLMQYWNQQPAQLSRHLGLDRYVRFVADYSVSPDQANQMVQQLRTSSWMAFWGGFRAIGTAKLGFSTTLQAMVTLLTNRLPPINMDKLMRYPVLISQMNLKPRVSIARKDGTVTVKIQLDDNSYARLRRQRSEIPQVLAEVTAPTVEEAENIAYAEALEHLRTQPQ